ncbi:lytic transglycosylase domain-containing protein [Jannaschia aquimarina]|uniref:Slt_4 protein n=1 Tax=Jannaschia aquimarina TaxID=935700 RepID=A0A0D1D9K5_9RHOB|nr:Soluble lytic murein transglycosylase precursor [Jannaschia aquimarina]SNT41594.1 Transglycosylase SLT domain-containing protein [Jannaschia aquimarina]
MIRDAGFRYASHGAIRRAGLSPRQWALLFQALVKIESAYNPRARSHVGAYGLGQLMPSTADYLGVDRYDPVQNLDGAVRYFLEMLDTFGTPELAIAAYNAGPEAVRRHGGIPPYRETQGHVRKVMAAYTQLTQNGGPRP